ncbi:hypothetical protein RI103_24185 [Paraburkholderia sp. FT54]|uniref:hypothetical protein n=1 Tax=Paraburkholderia sp. FT54 TaxID=3074437 RepID=UPI002877DF9A|nr:hypothetical protein [Paraburkholderia sp. FT54]WNC93883.1 hypothetical protein RI103_24185 [Paraburkholderia sp. FT54]
MEHMTRATQRLRVLNILITLIIAPLGKTLKGFRNMNRAMNVPTGPDSSRTFGKALINVLSKMV